MPEDFREQVSQWMTGTDTCYLLGAGCSACANKPLIDELTKRVMEGADSKLLSQFANLKQHNGRKATVEDLLTFLQRYRNVLSTISNSKGHDLSLGEIDSWVQSIKERIVNEITDHWQPNNHHRRFLRRIKSHRTGVPRDIFSLNYDTVIEANLDELRLPYTDGFRGTNRGWFDNRVFDEGISQAVEFRVFKLHGSINWTRDDSENVRRSAHPSTAGEPIVVYPSEQKYLQTQYGVYETLMSRFRDRLRGGGANNCLVVLGYSFNDDHINEAIFDAINTQRNNLTVIAFVGPDSDPKSQNARFDQFACRCRSRFNAFVGNHESGCFVGEAVNDEVANAILSASLWRFENLVEFIAGDDQ